MDIENMLSCIALISVGNPAYVNDLTLGLVRELRNALETEGIEIVGGNRVVTSEGDVRGLLGELGPLTGVDGVLLVISTWIEASMPMAIVEGLEGLPLAVWGFPMVVVNSRKESTGSLPGFAVVKGALDRISSRENGRRAVFILGLPSDTGAIVKFKGFARAARSFRRLKRAKLGLIGYASMSMYPGTFDHLLLRHCIGPEVDQVDTYSLIRLSEKVCEEKVEAFIKETRALVELSQKVDRASLIKAARLGVALEDLARERGWDALTVKCQYELSREYGMVACLPLSILAERNVVCGCEGDIPTLVGMLILALLSKDRVTYADVLDIDGNIVKFSSCGLAPPSFAPSGRKPVVTPFDFPGFSGLACGVGFKPGVVTYCRLAEGIGEYRLVYGVGEGLETDLRQGFLPALDVRLSGSVERFIDCLTSQHYALAYGDFRSELRVLSDLLGIIAEEI